MKNRQNTNFGGISGDLPPKLVFLASEMVKNGREKAAEERPPEISKVEAKKGDS